jgi:hypothetical protein
MCLWWGHDSFICLKKWGGPDPPRQNNETNSIRDISLFTLDLYIFDASRGHLVAFFFEKFWNNATSYIEI